MTRSAERWRFAVGIAILWPLGFVFGERYQDVPVQLPFYAMLAVAAGVGFAHLMHLRTGHRMVPAAVLLAFVAGVVTSLSVVHPLVVQQAQLAESLREDVRAMSAEARPEDAAIYVWPGAPIAQYDLVASPGTWIDYKLLAGFGDEEQQRQSWSELETAVADGRRIWLVLAPAPAIELLEGRGYRVSHAAGGMVAIAWLE
jgi:hypothetical protein